MDRLTLVGMDKGRRNRADTPRQGQAVAAAVASGSVATVLRTNAWLAYGVFATVIGVLVLVALLVLPVVWSRHAPRRDAAYHLLQLLLDRPSHKRRRTCGDRLTTPATLESTHDRRGQGRVPQ